MWDDIDMFGAHAGCNECAQAEKERVSGSKAANGLLVGQRGDPVQHGAEPRLDHNPLARKLGEEGEMAFAADQDVSGGHSIGSATRETRASVVANADDCNCALHVVPSAERSKSAWMTATAIGLPPLRPRATMAGAASARIPSLDSAGQEVSTATASP